MQTITANKSIQQVDSTQIGSLLSAWKEWEPARVNIVHTQTGWRYFQILLGSNYFNIGMFSAGGRHWNPLEIELAILDRAVRLAEAEQGWLGEMRAERRGDRVIYIARTHLNTHVVAYTEAEAEEPAIARLAAYINALKGWWAS